MTGKNALPRVNAHSSLIELTIRRRINALLKSRSHKRPCARVGKYYGVIIVIIIPAKVYLRQGKMLTMS